MTWVDDREKEKSEQRREQEESRSGYIKLKLQRFEQSYIAHQDQITVALKEIQTQGLLIDHPESVKYVNASSKNYENIKVVFFSFASEPWKFSTTVDPDPNKSPGYIWRIYSPNDRSICLWMCFVENQIIFRSGYKIYRVKEFIPHRGANIFNIPKTKTASNYGLAKKIIFYQDLGFYDHHILGELPLRVEDGYGETCLGDGTDHAIIKENIVNTAHDWFNFASKDI